MVDFSSTMKGQNSANLFMKLPPKFLRKVFPRRIWPQIFIILAVFVVVPLILLGFSLIRTSQKAIKTTVLRDHKELTIHATGEVREYIKGPIQALGVTAAILGTLQADPWQQETSLVELALRYPIFDRISFVDLKGREIVTSELGTDLYDRSREEVFNKAKLGETFISQVTVSEDHVPMLNISTPVEQLGNIQGVLIAELNLRGVWNLIDGIKVGESGRAYLVDYRGRLLSHPDKKMVLKAKNPFSSKIVEDLILGNAGNLEEAGQDNQHWLISYAPVEDLNWGLIIAQPTKEAFAFSKTMKMQSWFFIIVSIFVAVVISFILSKIMSRPINALIDATKRIPQGDFDTRLRVRRRDEIGRLFQSFNMMTRKLKDARRSEKLSVIGKSATTIAHELKNSLVSVNTYIELLPERYKDRVFIHDFKKTISQEIDSWKSMLQNMIDFSKFLEFEVTEIDIRELIADIGELARHRARQNGNDFILHLPQQLPRVMGNEDKLKQVFLNLINNAIEATPVGKTITMSVSVVRASMIGAGVARDYIQVCIEDTGEGIPSECLHKIFEPFYTTKQDGLGLGLAISQEIMAFHGGEIQVSSIEGKGSSFFINFPTVCAETAGGPKTERSRPKVS